MDKKEFNIKCVTPLLLKLRKDDKHYFLLGDFNINLLKCNSDHETFNFYRIMRSYFFTPLVLQQTCVTEKSKTSVVNNCTTP